ncbi:exonuclease subunit SbcD [Sodalis sp. dw_96]|uniref:exonuclease subunit SbcD n=1 Tax=Sodalis sp. dw_96 TaxID=2719794 RepID=UPI001BD585E9|nr:exonuclease subunit SbcD [Sodalis sp. dw_96]
MRIIHTSDWHLGQAFFTKTRAHEHQSFLRWLVAQVELHQVDAVVVAGDIFDTGTPPSYARELFNRFVVELQPTGCELIVLAGNHDAVATLNESRGLLACLNTRVIAGGDAEQPVFSLHERNGKPGAILCAIPFLRPRDMLVSRAGESGDDKQRSLMDAIAGHYRDLYQRAVALRDTLPTPVPIIATGHLTAVGASTSDSVRDIYIGSLDAFPAHLFPPADYIALGHIHRPQSVGGQPNILYCGSPIALSFDETGQPKQVNMVDFQPDQTAVVTPLTVPEVQPLRLIRGNLAEIETQLLAFRDYRGETTVWLDIEVTTDAWLNDVQRQIQHIAAGLPLDILLLRRNREQRRQTLEKEPHETLTELSVGEVFERRLAQAQVRDEEELGRIRLLYHRVVTDIRHEHPPQEIPR